MSRQRIFCHQLPRNLSCKRRFEAAPYVNLSKLFRFKLDIIAQLLALPRQIRLFGVGLRSDGDILRRRPSTWLPPPIRRRLRLERRFSLRRRRPRRQSNSQSRECHRWRRALRLVATQYDPQGDVQDGGGYGPSDSPIASGHSLDRLSTNASVVIS